MEHNWRGAELDWSRVRAELEFSGVGVDLERSWSGTELEQSYSGAGVEQSWSTNIREICKIRLNKWWVTNFFSWQEREKEKGLNTVVQKVTVSNPPFI